MIKENQGLQLESEKLIWWWERTHRKKTESPIENVCNKDYRKHHTDKASKTDIDIDYMSMQMISLDEYELWKSKNLTKDMWLYRETHTRQ